MQFDEYIGIDYSGAGQPVDRQSGLRVFVARGGEEPTEIKDPRDGRSWTRDDLRIWLSTHLRSPHKVLIGIDHAFSLPQQRLRESGIKDWQALLDAFVSLVKTQKRTVQDARRDPRSRRLLAEPAEKKSTSAFRTTDRRVPGSKSVFSYVGPGVAHSTMAGISQLALLRRELRAARARVRFWPFDGFDAPTASSLVVEVYPAFCNRQYERQAGTSGDQHDARSVALWLRDCAGDGRLERYLRPPLTAAEERVVKKEGWILGAM